MTLVQFWGNIVLVQNRTNLLADINVKEIRKMLDILFIVALIDAILVILPVLIPRRWCYFVYREICKADKKNKEKTDEK